MIVDDPETMGGIIWYFVMVSEPQHTNYLGAVYEIRTEDIVDYEYI